MNLTSRPIAAKPPKRKPNPSHLSRVRELPCCICHEYGFAQLSPTQAHHCIHGRYSARKAPDEMSLPLCEGHHQGMMDTSKLALHRHPSEWKRHYGPDTDWLSWVEKRLADPDGC